MVLRAILTIGWPEQRGDPALSAERLTDGGPEDVAQYGQRLSAVLAAVTPASPAAFTFTASDRLFRRRCRGFKRIRVFLAALNEVAQQLPAQREVGCEMDVFAYAFLKGAKNVDFFLPEQRKVDPADTDLYRNRVAGLRNRIKRLERFERRGSRRGLPVDERQKYCALRRLLTRASARDERRALAAMLVSGPSTVEEISQDLGLPYALGPRILPTLEGIGVLARRQDRFAIRLEALPRTVFLLRETLGIDLWEVLDV